MIRCPPNSILAISLLAAIVVASQQSFGSPALAAEAPQAIIVELDQAKLVSLPKGRLKIVLGLPRIVRVTQLLDSSHAVLTGMAFGETNMVVLDREGAVVMESTIRVKELSDTGVTVYRGQERTSYYDCARLCQGRMQLGDTSKEFADIGEQIRSREGQVTSSSPSSNPTAGPNGGL